MHSLLEGAGTCIFGNYPSLTEDAQSVNGHAPDLVQSVFADSFLISILRESVSKAARLYVFAFVYEFPKYRSADNNEK